MTRVARLISGLAIVIGGLIVAQQGPLGTSAQRGPVEVGHPAVGSWLVYETNPPAGGPPLLAGVATFSVDGTALIRFGDQQYQGSWIIAGRREAVFTVVAPSAGGFGEIDRLRGRLEVATDGGPFRGTYSVDIVRADESIAFTYSGPIQGRRVAVLEPEPLPFPVP